MVFNEIDIKNTQKYKIEWTLKSETKCHVLERFEDRIYHAISIYIQFCNKFLWEHSIWLASFHYCLSWARFTLTETMCISFLYTNLPAKWIARILSILRVHSRTAVSSVFVQRTQLHCLCSLCTFLFVHNVKHSFYRKTASTTSFVGVVASVIFNYFST